MSKKLPVVIRPKIIPLSKHDKLCDFKVKCPVCDELMLPYTIEPEYEEKPVLSTPCFFRMCPTCQSTFSFSSEAQKIIWEKTNQ